MATFKYVAKNQDSKGVTGKIVAENKEAVIEEKIDSILKIKYPQEKLEIIIGSDASTDATNRTIEKYGLANVKQSRRFN